MPNKIDSNVTGLAYAEEDPLQIGVLPGSPVWYPLEPNGYNDFGGQITTVARNPINPSRQRKKGVTTDLEASGGWGQDLTQNNLNRLFQGFFFSDRREKITTAPFNDPQIPITGVVTATDDYNAASGLDAFLVGDLVFATGFGDAANNGLKNVTAAIATALTVTQNLVDETPGAGANLTQVGFEFGVGEVDIDVSSQTYPRLVRASGTKDFTDFGLEAGEWVFIGGDGALSTFSTAENNGFARVREIGADFLEFDKTASTMADETGTTRVVQIFFGHVTRNENDPALIKRWSYQLERTLGEDDNGTMSEYLIGSVPNEAALQVRQADKVTVDLGFVSINNEQRDGTTGVKPGDRPALVDRPAFNTSSDFSRIKMHIVTAGDTNPDALFAFLTELTLTVNNGITPNKAVAVLGAFDVSAGQFTVNGSVTAYFADVAAVQAVRNNADVTLDMALVKDNAGMIWDIPLIALGEGRLNVEQDQPITLPLSMDGAEGGNNFTLVLNDFSYLPDLADV